MAEGARRVGWIVLPLLGAVLACQAVVLWAPLGRQGLTGPSPSAVLATFVRIAPIFLAASVVRAFTAALRARRLGRRIRLEWSASSAWAWDAVWILGVLSILATTYTWCKLYLPAYGGKLWDARLAGADFAWHLGVNPNVVLLTIFARGPRWAANAMDAYYCAFVTTMIAGAAWFFADCDRAQRVAFSLGFAVLWSAGLWWYIAMPALGPAFAFPEVAREVEGVFPAVASAQALLAENYRRVVVALADPGRRVLVAPQYGVAAMPSLHVAAHALLFLWACLVRSRLRAVLLAMTILTFLGSIATAWHYALDSWAGLLLAVLAVVPARFLLKVLRRRAASAARPA